MIKYLICLLLLAQNVLLAQGWTPVGARSNSMANASVALTDVWAFHHNPGALAELNEMSVGVSYENRFLLKELQTQGITFASPLKVGVISAGAQLYGYNLFRTYRAGVGYSLKLSEKFYGGVQLNYQGISIGQGYGSKNTVTGELGFIAKITDDWRLGLSIFNVTRARLDDYKDDRFNSLIRFGTSYNVSKKVLLTAEAEKFVEYDLRAKAGLEYEAISNFYLRVGVATAPIEISSGFGYKWNQFQLDLGTSYHQVLGWSPHFSFTYQGK